MSKKILIVEDEPALADAYAMLLRQAKYDVTLAMNGQEALDVTKSLEPDMILLDLRMPVLDGIGFLSQYEASEKHPDVKILVFSNYDMQEEIDKAYQLGADRYVLKAWASPREILQIVENTLS